jgi:hypothetical protein
MPNMAVVCGLRVTLTPHANALVEVRWMIEERARWVATNEEEHAVSTLMQGPCSPKV